MSFLSSIPSQLSDKITHWMLPHTACLIWPNTHQTLSNTNCREVLNTDGSWMSAVKYCHILIAVRLIFHSYRTLTVRYGQMLLLTLSIAKCRCQIVAYPENTFHSKFAKKYRGKYDSFMLHFVVWKYAFAKAFRRFIGLQRGWGTMTVRLTRTVFHIGAVCSLCLWGFHPPDL